MSASAKPLFVVESEREPGGAALVEPLRAEDVKYALRRHHPGADTGGMVGQWTCIEEWRSIDLLALNAWQKADVIGYEVKVSRSDLRRELLKPHKRADALACTTEFYLAVPEGLLTDEEVAFEEPEWEPGDFERAVCPGVAPFGPEYARERWGLYGPRTHPYGGRCYRDRQRRINVVDVPVPAVWTPPDWMSVPHPGETVERHAVRVVQYHQCVNHTAMCWNCDGRGYLAKSRVERDAPTCWVPRDLGLVTVSDRGVRIVKRSPRRKDPKPIAASRKQINDLVRWVSHRPDPRHR